MPNEQYEELDISKNSGKPYKNTNFYITEYSNKWRKLWFIYFILDTKISEESVFKLVQQKNYRVSISMTKILYAVKGGLYYHTVTKYIHLVTSIKTTTSVA